MKDPLSPYAPPKSSLETDYQESAEIVLVSKWLRLANLVIDYIGYMILAVIVGILVAIIWGEEGIKYMESIPDIVFGAPILLGYYIFFESLTGRTLGKLVTGTKVVNENGLRASFGQILGRSFSRLIPFEVFSFLGEKGRGWHDSLPRTYVVKNR